MDCQERTCSLSPVHEVIVQLVKMPARIMPACVPAIFAGWFFFVAASVVDGQVPQQGQSPVQQLVKQLAHADFDQRELAERQLIEIGSPAVDSLLKELINCKPDVCSRIKRILQMCSGNCDEESLFKVLGVLRFRFEVPDRRIEPLLQRWALQRRNELVAAWREQGAVVDDPLEIKDDALIVLGNRGQFRLAPIRPGLVFPQGGVVKIPTDSKQLAEADQEPEPPRRSNAELIKLVLEGTLEQNKKLVLNSKQGADGFEKKVALVQREPVTVTIGENWKGDYSVFDFNEATSVLPISGLELQKTEINDSLLIAIKKHPLATVAIIECSVAAGLKETLPGSVSTLSINGSNASADILSVLLKESPVLNRIRFVKSKFGKDEALMLKSFRRLMNVDLVRIDLEDGAFDGLAEVTSLRRLWLERCKFPSSGFIELKQKRGRSLNVEFTAKAFLGVGPVNRGVVVEFPRPKDQREPGDAEGNAIPRLPARGGCIIANVVPDEAAFRAGMKPGDEIVQIGEQEISSFDDLRVAIAQYEIGEEATLQVRRGGKEMTLKAEMGTPSD